MYVQNLQVYVEVTKRMLVVTTLMHIFFLITGEMYFPSVHKRYGLSVKLKGCVFQCMILSSFGFSICNVLIN